MDTSASILPWDPQGLASAEAAHKAKGERIPQVRLDQERNLRETTEREESARHAFLYRARHMELSKKLRELEAEEATAAEAYSRQMEAEQHIASQSAVKLSSFTRPPRQESLLSDTLLPQPPVLFSLPTFTAMRHLNLSEPSQLRTLSLALPRHGLQHPRTPPHK